ncbi:MAG TPA: hypothetical protein VHA57_09455 [Actinomycetota bacterium]|nr:hypothetical protein [Actinomycetota bacterium]
MPQMVIEDGKAVDLGVDAKAISNSGREEPPPPDPEIAPKGWRRDRRTGEWVPRQRAATGADDDAGDPAAAGDGPPRADSAWVDGPDGKQLAAERGQLGELVLTGDQRELLEGIIDLIALAPLATWDTRDPYCAGAAIEHWDQIRERLVPVICKSPTLVHWMISAGGARDWLALAVVLRPVGSAIWAHHVRHSVDDAGDAPDLSDFPA